MRFIRKGRTPAALSKFERENKNAMHVLRYDNLPSAVKAKLRQRLCAEQGRLCAYTMRRIGEQSEAGEWDCHIEHVQAQSIAEEHEVDYRNMVLCAPGPKTSTCDWGARRKKNAAVNRANFVSPLQADCEGRFTYLADGAVRPTKAPDAAAEKTIELLNLNHFELVELRRAALHALGLGPSAKPINARLAQNLSDAILLPSKDGALEAFCIAIHQVAAKYAARARARASRLARD